MDPDSYLYVAGLEEKPHSLTPQEDQEARGLYAALADSHIPAELKMAYKILKNADCLPPELELRKDILTLQELVASMEDEAEKLLQMRRLNFLLMKMGMMRPVSAQIMEHDLYTPKILEKLETKNKQLETRNSKLKTR